MDLNLTEVFWNQKTWLQLSACPKTSITLGSHFRRFKNSSGFVKGTRDLKSQISQSMILKNVVPNTY